MAIEKRCFSVLPDTLANMIAGYLSCTVISALIALASSALSLLPRPSINFNNNVCKTFAAYPFKWIDNKNCWENPDVWSDPVRQNAVALIIAFDTAALKDRTLFAFSLSKCVLYLITPDQLYLALIHLNHIPAVHFALNISFYNSVVLA